MRLDGQRRLPIERRTFGGDLRQRIVDEMMHHAARLVDAVLDERRADQRFDDVAQNRAFVRAALFRLAVAEQNVRADVQFFTGDFAQGFLGNRLRTHFGQLAFVHVGMHLVQRFRGDQFEHRVAEEFESFVVLGAFVLV